VVVSGLSGAEEVTKLAKVEELEGAEGESAGRASSGLSLSRRGSATGNFLTLNHKDAFLLFRALCKLSMKGLHDNAGDAAQSSDPIALQNKYVLYHDSTCKP
jgi:hypothetical protein